MSVLFVSHSSRDNAAAAALEKRLEEKGHRSVFLDLDPEKGIQAGASWERTLYTKLRACRAVVALCSDNYLASHWCFAEIALARMEGKELFCLRVDPWSGASEMPSILTEDQYIDLRTNEADGYERLWNGFAVKGIVPAEHRQWGPDDPPYPGLRAFEEKDGSIFFGRDQEIREGVELLNRVRRQGHPRVAMVLGASGSGKSSLTRAGIVPRLRLDESQWRVVGPLRPGREPARELAAAFASAFEEAGEVRSWKQIYERLSPESALSSGTRELDADADRSALEARQRLLQALRDFEADLSVGEERVAESVRGLRDLLAGTGVGARPESPRESRRADKNPLAALATELRLVGGPSEASVILVVDQFEELLGHDGRGPDHPANRFLTLLRRGVESDDFPPLLLGTMRSDYLGVFQRSELLQGVGFKSLSVGPMPREGMREVIEQPATLGQIELEKGLVDLLLDDTGTSDALPLLAFTLRVLWERYRDDRLLRIREYDELGRLQGAIAQVADETFARALELGAEEDLRDAFLSLARPNEEGSGWTRKPASWEEFGDQVRPMLQLFLDNRLLVKRADSTVEVAHEALFRSWGTLRRWLSANTEALHLRREIQVDAAKWYDAVDGDEKEPYLWRAGRLARALELREGGVLRLEERDRDFIEASESAETARREEEEQARRRELRRTRIVAGVIGVALLVAVWSYFNVQRQRQHTLSRQLAAQSSQLLETQLDLALLLALGASRVSDTTEARASLLAAVQFNPRLLRFLHRSDGALAGVAGVRGSSTLVAAAGHGSSTGSAVELWQIEDGRPTVKAVADPPEEADIVAVSPDGRWLASGGARLDLWELGVDTPRHFVREADGPVRDIAFCGRGESTSVAWSTAAPGTQVFEWRVARDPEPTMLDSEREVRSLAFLPGCGCLAAGHMHTGTIELLDLRGPSDGVARPTCPSPANSLDTAPAGHVTDITFDASGSTLLAVWNDFQHDFDAELSEAPADGEIHVWNLGTSERTTLRGHIGKIRGIAISADGETLASAGEDGVILLRDAASGEFRGDPLRGHEGAVSGLAFVADRTLVSGGVDGALVLWQLDRGPRLARHLTSAASGNGHTGEVWSVAFNPRDGTLASASTDGTARLWDLASAKQAKGGGSILIRDDGGQTALSFSADGTRLASGSAFGGLHVWRIGDEMTAERLWSNPEPDGYSVSSLALRQDGLALDVAVGDEIVRWDLEASPPLGESLATVPGGYGSVLFREGGETLLAGSQGGEVWEISQRANRPLLPAAEEGGAVWGLAQSSDETLLAASRDTRIHLMDMPDGSSSSEPLRGHPAEILSLVVDSGAETLFSADYAGNILAWDVPRRKEIGRFDQGHLEGMPINSLALSPDGRTLASAGDDRAIVLWDLDWSSVACDVAGRDLRDDEWRAYVVEGQSLPRLCSSARME